MGKVAYILQGNTLPLVVKENRLHTQGNIPVIEEGVGLKVVLKTAEVYIR